MSTDSEAWICNIKRGDELGEYLFIRKLVEWARAGKKNSFRVANVFCFHFYTTYKLDIKREADSIAFGG